MNPTFRRFASSFLFAVSSVAALACSGAPGTGSPSVETTSMPPANVEKIDAPRLGALPAGQKLLVDLTQPDVAYDFDFSAAPIDFSRITLRFADGFELAMDAWRVQAGTDGVEFAAGYPDHFVLRPTASAASGDRDHKTVRADLPPPCVAPCCNLICVNVCQTADGPCVNTCTLLCD